MFELVLKTASFLVNTAEILIDLGPKRRAKLATYFDNISNVMQTYVDKIRIGEEPPPLCAELTQYAKAIRDVSKRRLKPNQIESLVNELENACSNWRKLDRTDSPVNQSYKDVLNELDSAAASFRGFANVLRAK